MILYLYKSVCDFIRCIGKWLQIHQADSKSLDHFSYMNFCYRSVDSECYDSDKVLIIKKNNVSFQETCVQKKSMTFRLF